jgi:hypothetical protein
VCARRPNVWADRVQAPAQAGGPPDQVAFDFSAVKSRPLGG